MITLLEYVVENFERNPDKTLKTLSEWSLCCMSALRTKDIDCSTSIHLVTKKTIETLLSNLDLETTRPWTSVRKIEEGIRAQVEQPLLLTIANMKDRIESLTNEHYALKSRYEILKEENSHLQSELRSKSKAWFK